MTEVVVVKAYPPVTCEGVRASVSEAGAAPYASIRPQPTPPQIAAKLFKVTWQ